MWTRHNEKRARSRNVSLLSPPSLPRAWGASLPSSGPGPSTRCPLRFGASGAARDIPANQSASPRSDVVSRALSSFGLAPASCAGRISAGDAGYLCCRARIDHRARGLCMPDAQITRHLSSVVEYQGARAASPLHAVPSHGLMPISCVGSVTAVDAALRTKLPRGAALPPTSGFSCGS